MGPVTLPVTHSSDPIRQLDLSRDLDHVADLIELCFPILSDPDGQKYVNEMRKTAREMRLMGWLAGFSDQYPMRSSGYVWEASGEIIGNLSLIPLQKNGRRVHLIANVAVHPDHRRRGIARRLTQHALNELKRQHGNEVWLQVRDDNPPAVALYRSLGFTDQAVRTTWYIRPHDLKPQSTGPELNITLRQLASRDWLAQRAWLEAAYPPVVRWNLPLNYRRFTPGLTQWIANTLEGTTLKHWVVFLKSECAGVITWQKSDLFANHLWLAFPPEHAVDLLPTSLAYVLKHLPKRHPLSIDYPKDRCAEQLSALGFEAFRSLIWMVLRF